MNKKEMAFIGIDPGITGASALLFEDIVEVVDWTSIQDAIDTLDEWMMLYPIKMAALENVHAMSYVKTDMATGKQSRHSQKGSSNFKFGRNFGNWEAILTALAIPFELVTPQKWQAGVVPRKLKKHDKPSFEVARQLFPTADLKFKTKHHNRADALLIADWARRTHK